MQVIEHLHDHRREHVEVIDFGHIIVHIGHGLLDMLGQFGSGILLFKQCRIGHDRLQMRHPLDTVREPDYIHFVLRIKHDDDRIHLREHFRDTGFAVGRERYFRLTGKPPRGTEQQYEEDHQRHFMMRHEASEGIGRQHKHAFGRAHHRLVEHQQQRRQNRKRTNQTAYHTFRQHKAHVHTDLQPHEQQHQQADNGR